MTLLMYNTPLDKEPTLLSPLETAWRCEAWLLDTRYIQHWNQYDEYTFSFAPQTMFDHQALFELIDNARSLVEMRKDRYSHKVKTNDKTSYEKAGSLYCSQLFLPKLNIELPYADYLDGKLVSLAGYIRDSPDGRLYLQCSYCDVYEGDEPSEADAAPTDALSEAGTPAEVVDDDW